MALRFAACGLRTLYSLPICSKVVELPVTLWNCVNDDLSKAEREWANRSLFRRPRRRRRWRWLLPLLLAVLALAVLQQSDYLPPVL